jgi:hypothetical protein
VLWHSCEKFMSSNCYWFAQKSGVSHKFPCQQDIGVSVWLFSFPQRNLEVSIRHTEGLSFVQLMNVFVSLMPLYRFSLFIEMFFINRRKSPQLCLVEILTLLTYTISSHLHLGLPSGLCSSDSPTKILHASHLLIFPFHQIRFNNPNSIMWGLQMM